MSFQAHSPIRALPANSALPKASHKLAAQWRELNKRASELDVELRTATADVAVAKLEDAEAIKASVLAGETPDKGNREEEAVARVVDLQKTTPIVRAERDRVGAELVHLLRSDENRDFVAEQASQALGDALSSYKQALADAEESVSAAHSELTRSSTLLSLVEALDTGSAIRLTQSVIDTVNFAPARLSLAKLDKRIAGLSERTRPAQRRVRTNTGSVVTLRGDLAAQMHGRGEIAEWLDGWDPEAPITPSR